MMPSVVYGTKRMEQPVHPLSTVLFSYLSSDMLICELIPWSNKDKILAEKCY